MGPSRFDFVCQLSIGRAIRVALITALQFILYGAACTMLLRALAPESGLTFAVLAGLNALALIAGLIVPGAPAGLGVREVVFVSLLQGKLDPGVILALVAGVRIVQIVSDLATSAIAHAAFSFTKGEACHDV